MLYKVNIEGLINKLKAENLIKESEAKEILNKEYKDFYEIVATLKYEYYVPESKILIKELKFMFDESQERKEQESNNNLFLQKFCSALRLREGKMVLSYDFNRRYRALICVDNNYNIQVEEVSHETDYKWSKTMETNIPLDSELSVKIAELKPKTPQAAEDE